MIKQKKIPFQKTETMKRENIHKDMIKQTTEFINYFYDKFLEKSIDEGFANRSRLATQTNIEYAHSHLLNEIKDMDEKTKEKIIDISALIGVLSFALGCSTVAIMELKRQTID